MELFDLKPAEGSVRKNKRVGRGQGSGRGGTSTRGHKGDQSRSGYRTKPGFEGGQMPLKLRVPKFGFKNHFRVSYSPINLDLLDALADQYGVLHVDPEFLSAHGVVDSSARIKILARGAVSKGLAVKAHAFSAGAKAAIEQAGGSVEILS
jgi:large subunit ribosomal protein L15